MHYRIKLFTIALLFLGFLLTSCGETSEEQAEAVEQNETTMEEPAAKEKLLRHMVIFKFKDEAPQEEVDKINKAFYGLSESIPVIKDFEWGLNDSPEDFHQGFTHCYMLTFASEEDRDSVYSPHPEHQAFVASLQPHLEKVFVVDYWTE